MTPAAMMRQVQVALASVGARVFRNNVGQGWVGMTQPLQGGAIMITDPRPLHAGLCDGSSDLIGWRTVVVTPSMVGSKIAVFAAVEVKQGTGRCSAEQLGFLAAVKAAGGIAFVATGADQAQETLRQSVLEMGGGKDGAQG